MAKDSLNTKPKTETPFQKFEQLAKKLARVPKSHIWDRKQPKTKS